jgi:cyclopropane-fatty-acyl-phospholipid synthase
MGRETLATSIMSADTQVQASLTVLKALMGGYTPRDFAVRFWDGTTWDSEPGQPARFTLVLHHPGSVRKMFWPPGILTPLKAYVYDDYDIEGDLVGFCNLCGYLEDLKPTLSVVQQLSLGWRLWNLPKVERPRGGRQMAQLHGAVHSRERDQQAIRYHYDVSNEFFELVLGPQMVYTSGIFADPSEDLAAAQERKLDLICRKLRLKPGERLLDIGCGWGGLVMHAARNYGVQAVGVTISQRQADWARDKIRAAGLETRCRIDLVDYRDVDEREPFDKIVTVEVIEHFGAAQFPAFFQKCGRLLRPQGSLLIQQITQADPSAFRGALEFSQHFIFPDGELTTIGFTYGAAEKAGFEVRDMECIREHYCLTLQHWLRSLEARHDDVVRITDEANFRIFRLHYAGSVRAFANNVYNLHQTLYVKPDGFASGYPFGREDWYAEKGE